MLARVNYLRSKAGVSPLVMCGALTTAAQNYADLMASTNTFPHTGPDGSMPADRVEAAGYNWDTVGENIGQGFTSVVAAMNAWFEEGCQNPSVACGHYTNMVKAVYEHVGFGWNSASALWGQDFGSGSCPA